LSQSPEVYTGEKGLPFVSGLRCALDLCPSHRRSIRTLTLDPRVAAANSGHSGMPMGMADVATVLFEKHLKFDAAAPTGPTATGSSCRRATARCCSTRFCT
jgi:hypothetical protein